MGCRGAGAVGPDLGHHREPDSALGHAPASPLGQHWTGDRAHRSHACTDHRSVEHRWRQRPTGNRRSRGVRSSLQECPPVPLRTVLREVRVAGRIRALPNDLNPSLPTMELHPGATLGHPLGNGCTQGGMPSSMASCTFGDPSGTHTIVLYGDSHAGMWFRQSTKPHSVRIGDL